MQFILLIFRFLVISIIIFQFNTSCQWWSCLMMKFALWIRLSYVLFDFLNFSLARPTTSTFPPQLTLILINLFITVNHINLYLFIQTILGCRWCIVAVDGLVGVNGLVLAIWVNNPLTQFILSCPCRLLFLCPLTTSPATLCCLLLYIRFQLIILMVLQVLIHKHIRLSTSLALCCSTIIQPVSLRILQLAGRLIIVVQESLFKFWVILCLKIHYWIHFSRFIFSADIILQSATFRLGTRLMRVHLLLVSCREWPCLILREGGCVGAGVVLWESFKLLVNFGCILGEIVQYFAVRSSQNISSGHSWVGLLWSSSPLSGLRMVSGRPLRPVVVP